MELFLLYPTLRCSCNKILRRRNRSIDETVTSLHRATRRNQNPPPLRFAKKRGWYFFIPKSHEEFRFHNQLALIINPVRTLSYSLTFQHRWLLFLSSRVQTSLRRSGSVYSTYKKVSLQNSFFDVCLKTGRELVWCLYTQLNSTKVVKRSDPISAHTCLLYSRCSSEQTHSCAEEITIEFCVRCWVSTCICFTAECCPRWRIQYTAFPIRMNRAEKGNEKESNYLRMLPSIVELYARVNKRN